MSRNHTNPQPPFTAQHTNHPTQLQYDEITAHAMTPGELGDEAQLWTNRVWATHIESEYPFLCSTGSASGTRARCVHLTPEFFDGEDPPPSNDDYDGLTACQRDWCGDRWRAKPATAYPPGYRPVCGHCMRAFMRWWLWNERQTSRSAVRQADAYRAVAGRVEAVIAR